MIRRVSWLAIVAFVMGYAGIAAAQYAARPIIVSLTPASGPPGSQVKITGQNFGPEYQVLYNGVPLTPVSVTPTEIVVKIPANAMQGRFTLKGPVQQVVSPQVFWVVETRAVPVVTDIQPTFGAPGTVVTINGNNFSTKAHENAVTMGGVGLAVRAASTTRIQALVPPSARTGNVTVQVFTAGQATSPMAFTVLAELKIESFNPPMGPPGTPVTLKGAGFST
ncbi:MAG: IPT/TIG domain-containing protein, partial [Deltaproteobacteria bacterium]|nr:IPT/TIG domain-containing protein [Deltaproteobacteria bacterium]